MKKWSFNSFNEIMFINNIHIGIFVILGMLNIFLLIIPIIVFFKWQHISKILLTDNLEISYLKNGKFSTLKILKSNIKNMHIRFNMEDIYWGRFNRKGYNIKTTISINDIENNSYTIFDNSTIHSLLMNCHIIEGLLELAKDIPDCSYEIICSNNEDKQELEYYAKNLVHSEMFSSQKHKYNKIGKPLSIIILTIGIIPIVIVLLIILILGISALLSG